MLSLASMPEFVEETIVRNAAALLQYRGCAETVYLLPPEKHEKTFCILLGEIATRILLTL